MPTTLNRLVLAKSIIVGSDGVVFKEARLSIVDGVAYVYDNNGADRGSRPGVTGIAVQTTGWAVTFENGDTWDVQRDSGCGCGG